MWFLLRMILCLCFILLDLNKMLFVKLWKMCKLVLSELGVVVGRLSLYMVEVVFVVVLMCGLYWVFWCWRNFMSLFVGKFFVLLKVICLMKWVKLCLLLFL